MYIAKREVWLQSHIIKHFKEYFNFDFVGEEIRLVEPRGERADMVGEDENYIYVIELKLRRILDRHLPKLKKYMLLYEKKFNPIKPVKGVFTAPECTLTALIKIQNDPELEFVMLDDVVAEGSMNILRCTNVLYSQATIPYLRKQRKESPLLTV